MKIRTYKPTDEQDVVDLWTKVFPDEPAWNESRKLIQRKLTVQPDYCRQGVSRKLMQAAEAGLIEKGCTKLNLQVRGSNNSAAKFYASMDYQVEERISMSKHLGKERHE